MIITGKIPIYYEAHEILSDPRDLYFSLDSGDFQYYQPSRMQGLATWQRVVDCFVGTTVDPIKLAMQSGQEGQEVMELASRLNANLTKLKDIEKVDLPTQVAPHTAGLEEAIDIFDRINSQGIKLTDAELALTIRPDPFTTEAGTRSWLETALDYLMSVLPKAAYVHGTDDLNTTNALIPIVAYLSRSNGTFPNQRSIGHAVNWLSAALIWGRYTEVDPDCETAGAAS